MSVGILKVALATTLLCNSFSITKGLSQEQDPINNRVVLGIPAKEESALIKIRSNHFEVKAFLNRIEIGKSEMSYEEASRFFELFFQKETADIVVFDGEKAINDSLDSLLNQLSSYKKKRTFSIVVFPCKPSSTNEETSMQQLVDKFLSTGKVEPKENRTKVGTNQTFQEFLNSRGRLMDGNLDEEKKKNDLESKK